MGFVTGFFVLLAVLVVFNIMIIVHELGHFLAAKWRGLYVDRFGIWFGKPLWKKKVGDVTYSLGSIPAGGFVSVPQLAPMEMIEGRLDEETNEKLKRHGDAKPLDKIIVAFAGPFFSLLLAFVCACIVWLVGKPENLADTSTQIGYVLADTPAAEAGLQAGDEIVTMNGHRVKNYTSNTDAGILWNIITDEDGKISMTVNRGGELLEFEVAAETPETKAHQRPGLPTIGITWPSDVYVGRVFPNSPAHAAGLRPGDQILAIDGNTLESRFEMSDYLKAHPDQQVELSIKRGDETFPVSLTPEEPVSGMEEPSPMIGIEFGEARYNTLANPNPFTQVKDSALMVYNTLGALIQQTISPKLLSGPVGIINLYYQLLTVDQGWRLALWFSVILNVNLAILNMLPFPVLDGGHITLSLLEWIRKRPVSMKFLEILQGAFALALIGFMLFVTFYDVQDIPVGNQEQGSVPVFEEKPGLEPLPE